MGKPVYIADDVMRAAEKFAAERGVTIDEVVSDLARQGLTRSGLTVLTRGDVCRLRPQPLRAAVH